MGDKKVLAGSPEDLRWQPGVVPGMSVPEPEKEPAVEPEAATEDLAAVAVSPKELPPEAPEVPPVPEVPEPEPTAEPDEPLNPPVEETTET